MKLFFIPLYAFLFLISCVPYHSPQTNSGPPNQNNNAQASGVYNPPYVAPVAPGSNLSPAYFPGSRAVYNQGVLVGYIQQQQQASTAPVVNDDDDDDDRDDRDDDRDDDDDDDRDRDRDRNKISAKNSLFASGSGSSRLGSSSSSESCKADEWDDDMCFQDDLCAKSCDKLFNTKKARSKCHDYPLKLVYEMKLLSDDLKEGEVSDISGNVLRCMLKIDEHPFAREVRRFNDRDKRDLLGIIAEESEIADIIYDADEEFNIFDQLAGNDLNNLKVNISSGDNFLEIVTYGSYNDEAWSYLDDYIKDHCDTGSNCEYTYNGEQNSPMVAYCELLSDKGDSDIENVIENDLFKEEYETYIEKNIEKEPDEDSIIKKYRSCGVRVGTTNEEANRCEDDNAKDFKLVCEKVYDVDMKD